MFVDFVFISLTPVRVLSLFSVELIPEREKKEGRQEGKNEKKTYL